MNKKLTIAVIGCGTFAYKFINLFKNHPNTEKVYVCDLVAERANAFAAQFGIETIATFEDALEKEDVNAIAVFTSRHQHGDLTIRALKAGKSFMQTRSLRGKVHSYEIPTTLAVFSALGEVKTCHGADFLGKGDRVVGISANVYPHKIGRLAVNGVKPWQALFYEPLCHSSVFKEVFAKLVKPLVAVGKGGDICRHGKYIRLTDLIGVYSAPHLMAQVRVIDNKARRLKPCKVKAL